MMRWQRWGLPVFDERATVQLTLDGVKEFVEPGQPEAAPDSGRSTPTAS